MTQPRFNEPLSLWLVRDEKGARTYSSLTQAEAAAGEHGKIYRGPVILGHLIQACGLEEVPRDR